MLRASLRRLPLARTLHTFRPAASRHPVSLHRFAPAAAATLATVGLLAWQVARPDRVLALDSSKTVEEPRADTPFGDDQPAVDLLHAKAEEADESTEVPPGEDYSDAAFNPDTGEINWDCPCLGGMAHGPCGEQFKAAFSCFVYSDKEPKGVDCVDKFRLMQDCFREHPDVYGEEDLMEGEEEGIPPADLPASPETSPSPSTSELDMGVLTEPEVHTISLDVPEDSLPAAPKTSPPASSPVLKAHADSTTKTP